MSLRAGGEAISSLHRDRFPAPNRRDGVVAMDAPRYDISRFLPYTVMSENVAEQYPSPLLERETSMAGKEQVEILRRGSEVWNHWRKENPKEDIELIAAD